MGRPSKRPPIELNSDEIRHLLNIASSPCETGIRRARARVLLAYAKGMRISAMVEQFQMNRLRIVRFIDQALTLGVPESLKERRGRALGSGRPKEAIDWLMALAEASPKDFGSSLPVWNMGALAAYARHYGPQAGHPCLANLSRAAAYRYFALRKKSLHKQVTQGMLMKFCAI